jgi:hypothetical protein
MKKSSLSEGLKKMAERPAPVVESKDTFTLSARMPVAVRRVLRAICADEDLTVQEALGEALNDFFVKHGKVPVAPGRGKR